MKKDPFETNIQGKCAACGKDVLLDEVGNGDCNNCGWYNNEIGLEDENRVVFPNMISLSKARKLVKEGKPFEISLDDFIEALYFYSEVEFDYNGNNYGLILIKDRKIELSSKIDVQIFADAEDFKSNAKVEGKLLKDIWHEVTNAKYM